MIVDPSTSLSRAEISSHIGGLNGRKTFTDYLQRKADDLSENGAGRDAVISMVRREHKFWSGLLKNQMRKYDLMRREDSPICREYVLIHYEFDDLFRFCADPVSTFNIDIIHEPDQDTIDDLVVRFRSYIKKHGGFLPEIDFPLSLTRYYLSGYGASFKAVLSLLQRLFRRKNDVGAFWIKVFTEAILKQTAHLKRLNRFWTTGILFGILFNAVLFYFMLAGIPNLSGIKLIEFTLFTLAIEFAFLPISIRAVIQYKRSRLAFVHGKKSHVAFIKTWNQTIYFFEDIWSQSSVQQKQNYFEMLEEMLEDHVINQTEYDLLKRRDRLAQVTSISARERVQRWCNRHYISVRHAGSDKWNPIPAIASWDDVHSLTILVFSLNEKFFYTWDELIRTSFEGRQLIASVLETLQRAYSAEWKNLLHRLKPILSDTDQSFLLATGSDLSNLTNKSAITTIELWANIRLQTIFNTLEGSRKIYKSYKKLAVYFFPSASAEKVDALVRDKLQIMLLHDYYPLYPEGSDQRAQIDRYFAAQRDVSLHWPKDLIHASKSGAWANVVSSIKGEYLMTLDSDHSICIEEIDYLPNLLREFDLDPELDAVQYRLYTFNEKYSWTSKYAGLASDSWWGQELRVKALVGGGGVYGKLVYRVSAIEAEELVQPDSVGEDMLTMARLHAENSTIRFVEYMQIGQGEETTFEGIKRKYGRYPIGGLESGFSKVFKKMLLSTKTYRHKKLESLFMISYYPIQVLIVFANIVVISGLIFNITFFYVYLPAILILIGYMLLVSDGLLSVVNLVERHGYLRGIGQYCLYFLPMSIFHSSYIPFYTQQFRKGLKGYARFNMSEKMSEAYEGSWSEGYTQNRITINIGSVLLGLAITGLALHPLTIIGYIAYFPFIFNCIVWTIGPFFYIARRKPSQKVADILVGLPYVIAKSYYDLILGFFYTIRGFLQRRSRPPGTAPVASAIG